MDDARAEVMNILIIYFPTFMYFFIFAKLM